MCPELDVVDVKVDNSDDGYVVLRMTWNQHKAYRAGRFTPRYSPGTSDDWMLDDDGYTFEVIDVTSQTF